MNLLLLLESDFASADRAVVKGRRSQHLHSIKKVQPGDRIATGVLGGLMGEAIVVNSNANKTELMVSLTVQPPSHCLFTLYLRYPDPRCSGGYCRLSARWALKN